MREESRKHVSYKKDERFHGRLSGNIHQDPLSVEKGKSLGGNRGGIHGLQLGYELHNLGSRLATRLQTPVCPIKGLHQGFLHLLNFSHSQLRHRKATTALFPYLLFWFDSRSGDSSAFSPLPSG
ncbi:hypothetical protein AMTR_s00016p00122340 [Amborella trichopoda]|uniref:Uncharacterized protein n=1 Tax=Amborella trichopoda TaxID=13333 RepID=W1PEY5_AMBTC|nr:hypothetical protein AMTR_s00016p00122340 [Amborella trichopoda]